VIQPRKNALCERGRIGWRRYGAPIRYNLRESTDISCNHRDSTPECLKGDPALTPFDVREHN
jgi:hypothetical protein